MNERDAHPSLRSDTAGGTEDIGQAVSVRGKQEVEADETATGVGQRRGRRDQAAEDREHAAANRDQAASDRDQSGAETDEQSLRRGQAAKDREHAAAERDRSASERDQSASESDRSNGGFDARSSYWGQTAEDRERAAADREWSAADRDQSIADVEKRASHRGQAAEDRAHAAADREQAGVDRAADTRDYDQKRAELRRAQVDQLTGAFGRELGALVLEREMDRARRGSGHLVLTYVDVDGLKQINDSKGHAAGDTLLRDVVQAIQKHLRSYDAIVRLGGDEFVCAVVDCSPDDARRRFQDIRATLGRIQPTASISVGYAALRPEDTLEQLTLRGDKALYEAKESG